MLFASITRAHRNTADSYMVPFLSIYLPSNRILAYKTIVKRDNELRMNPEWICNGSYPQVSIFLVNSSKIHRALFNWTQAESTGEV
jgi:hypothetical protein